MDLWYSGMDVMQDGFERIRILMRLVPDRTVIAVCRCGPLGRVRKGPGTMGSLGGLALYTVLFFPLGLVGQSLLLLVGLGVAVAFCDEGERRLAKRDPGEIVLDELVAVPLCFLGMKPLMLESGAVWAYMLAGFALFRLYDIVKPFGINRLQSMAGGVGVVLDDVAAAFATNLTLWALTLALQVGGWI